MEVIKSGYNISSVSVPTEEQIDLLLKRDAGSIDSKYKYVDLYIASIIKKYGIHKTQNILNQYLGKDRFFICQHEQINKLFFGDSTVFAVHSKINDNYTPIPHYTLTTNNIKDSEKDTLFSFIGSITTHPIRKYLVENYDSCYDSKVHWAIDPTLPSSSKNELQQQYKELVSKSTFSLCPRGTGISSIRIFEVMSMGSIPVLIGDNYDKPLNEILDWKEFSVTIKEHNIDQIEDILFNFSQKDIILMKNKVLEVYNEYFSNENLHKTIIHKIKNNGT